MLYTYRTQLVLHDSRTEKMIISRKMVVIGRTTFIFLYAIRAYIHSNQQLTSFKAMASTNLARKWAASHDGLPRMSFTEIGFPASLMSCEANNNWLLYKIERQGHVGLARLDEIAPIQDTINNFRSSLADFLLLLEEFICSDLLMKNGYNKKQFLIFRN